MLTCTFSPPLQDHGTNTNFPTYRSLFGVGLIAYTILIISRSPALSYFAVYLAVSWAYSSLLTIKVVDKAYISTAPSTPPYVSTSTR